MPKPDARREPSDMEALNTALSRYPSVPGYADGGTVDDESTNEPLPIKTKAVAASDSLQSLGSGDTTANTGGGGMQMPGQDQFGKLPSADVPNFPKINLMNTAYNPALRGTPTPQARQQMAAQALQPFLNALAKLKSPQT